MDKKLVKEIMDNISLMKGHAGLMIQAAAIAEQKLERLSAPVTTKKKKKDEYEVSPERQAELKRQFCKRRGIIITALLAVTMLHTQAQGYLGAMAGVTTKNAIGGMMAGYTQHYFMLEGSVMTHLDNRNPAYFNAFAGYQLLGSDNSYLSLLGGMSYSKIGAIGGSKGVAKDGIYAGAALRGLYKHVFAQVSYMGRVAGLQVGIVGLLHNPKNY